MSIVDQAQEILKTFPLPVDAEARIDALYEQADETEKLEFHWIYEGLAKLLNANPSPA